ncbi:homogentisate phytyltransferase 1, chloroplastic-like [Humulus lupulus]|uniref:homogentisate phytyltransferase 1, chloroplastic-like n=1 Tax=Humulus lupulus TaxID=3486 RepID=UPI002B40B354|nr:homogentisate phytyltransferase 1, chloroplastic-like [Humulus lupulus]
MLEAVAAALLMNIYIVGLNQLYDIDIDKVPLLRWKRFALVAAMCILAVRAVIVQLAFFLHMQVLGHTILASILWTNAKSVDLSSKAAITSFYMFIWKVNNYGAKFNLFGAQFSLTKLQK